MCFSSEDIGPWGVVDLDLQAMVGIMPAFPIHLCAVLWLGRSANRRHFFDELMELTLSSGVS
jgi:hypothetical protein